MDYFLLDDTENLKQYAMDHLWNQLNPLEKVLLVVALKDDALRKRTLRYFQNQQKMLRVSPQEMDKLFRTALAEKQLSSDFDTKPMVKPKPTGGNPFPRNSRPKGGYSQRRGSAERAYLEQTLS